jgi:hypothetical protein
MKRCRRARDLVKARALARAIAGTDRTNIHETVKMRERERERERDRREQCVSVTSMRRDKSETDETRVEPSPSSGFEWRRFT